MNLEKVVFGFFILLAATLNFGFVYGDIEDPSQHNRWELFAALVVNLIAAGEGGAMTPAAIAAVVSLAAGALLANIVSVVIMVVETIMQRR